MVRTGTPLANITMIESPRYGSFNLATQVFSPAPDFWAFGLDRLIINIQGIGPKVLLLVAASPLRNHTATENFDGGAVGTWTLGGAATYTLTSTANGYALRVQGAPGQTSTFIPPTGNPGRPIVAVGLGSGINPGAPPAPFGDQGEEMVVQSISGVLDVVLKAEAGAHYVRVKAVHPGFGCGGTVVCESPYQQIPANTWTRVSAVDRASHRRRTPQHEKHHPLRRHPGRERHRALRARQPQSGEPRRPLSSPASAWPAPMSPTARVEIDDAETFSLQQSVEDERILARSERFEAPGVGYENTWSQEGVVGFQDAGRQPVDGGRSQEALRPPALPRAAA